MVKLGSLGPSPPPQGWALFPAGPEAPADPSRKGRKWSPRGSLETSKLTCVTLRREGVAPVSQPPHPARKQVLESNSSGSSKSPELPEEDLQCVRTS